VEIIRDLAGLQCHAIKNKKTYNRSEKMNLRSRDMKDD